MIITVRTEELKRVMSSIVKFIPKKVYKNVLNQVRVSCANNRVILEACDSSSFLLRSIEVLGGNSNPKDIFLVNADDFNGVIKNISAKQVVLEFNSDDSPVLSITADDSDITLPVMSPDDFPTVNVNQKTDFNTLSILGSDLSKLIKSVLQFSSDDPSQGMCSSIKIYSKGDYIVSEAFSPVMMHSMRIEYPDEKLTRPLSIPKHCADALATFADIFVEEVVTLSYTHDARFVWINIGADSILLRETDYEFPDIKKIIPADYDTIIETTKKEFESMLKTSSAISSGAALLRVVGNKISIAVSDPGRGRADMRVSAFIQGADTEVAIYAKNFIDVLSKYSSDDVCICINKSMNRVVVTEGTNQDRLDNVNQQYSLVMLVNMLEAS